MVSYIAWTAGILYYKNRLLCDCSYNTHALGRGIKHNGGFLGPIRESRGSVGDCTNQHLCISLHFTLRLLTLVWLMPLLSDITLLCLQALYTLGWMDSLWAQWRDKTWCRSSSTFLKHWGL